MEVQCPDTINLTPEHSLSPIAVVAGDMLPQEAFNETRESEAVLIVPPPIMEAPLVPQESTVANDNNRTTADSYPEDSLLKANDDITVDTQQGGMHAVIPDVEIGNNPHNMQHPTMQINELGTECSDVQLILLENFSVQPDPPHVEQADEQSNGQQGSQESEGPHDNSLLQQHIHAEPGGHEASSRRRSSRLQASNKSDQPVMKLAQEVVAKKMRVNEETNNEARLKAYLQKYDAQLDDETIQAMLKVINAKSFGKGKKGKKDMMEA
ncbi:hypothetical protein BS78_07G008400 [Paspalum vaginatum]|nr:hypothetical protein BS78_07G008400 [Paspalum vaginatum]